MSWSELVWWQVAIACVFSYLIGNLSVARLIAGAKHQDVTKLGSGNPGTTNILRNFGFKLGLLNLILDMLKGVIPTLAGFLIFDHSLIVLYMCGFSVMLGHIYPILFKFKGGKGIATMLGVFLVADPFVTLGVILLAALSWLFFEYGSVASFLCVTLMTVVEGLKAKALPDTDSKVVCFLLFLIFIFTWFAHRTNIERLLCGKENKASLIKKAKKSLGQKK